MRKKKLDNQKKIIIIGSLCLLLCLCVGYAAFQTTISLKAKGNVKEKPAAEKLKELVVTTGDGLYEDAYEEGRYFYKGSNPNNYITFNNETWRIISVESDGTIKILRNESIGNQVWSSTSSNAWDKPANIKTYLNETYLPTITTNQDKIAAHTWSIGAVEEANSNLTEQITSENGTQSQSSTIGLITVSEYLRVNTNTEQCGNLNLNNTNKETCKTTNWIQTIVPSNGYLWTISPDTVIFDGVFSVSGTLDMTGNVFADMADGSNGVAPVLYLSADIKLSGEGTELSPYVIE